MFGPRTGLKGDGFLTSKTVIRLKRGPIKNFASVQPMYDGEICMCTDEPLFMLWNGSEWVGMPIPDDCKDGLRKLYGTDEFGVSW